MKKRSNINLYQLILFIGILFAGFSCNDKFFDEQAGERITPDDHFKSLIDLEISMLGAMAPLQETMPKMIMLDGLRSDQMDITPMADGYLRAINNQSITVDNTYIDGSGFYKVIINVNEVLKNIDKVAANDRELDEFLLHFTKGALVGLRTWSYLNIVKLYGKAAIIPDNMTSIPANGNQTFLTKEVMIDTLINQIKPYIFDNNATTEYVEYSFSGYMNTKALLGELYLEKNDYANAAMYLKLALESHGNSTSLWKLDKTYTNEGWKNIFVNAEGAYNENISFIPYNFNESQPNPLTKWMLAKHMYVVKPTTAVVDSFKNQIQLSGSRSDLARGIKVSFDTTSTGEPFITKYALDGEPFNSDIVLSRAADLHLLLAEALNRMGDSKTAMIILNAGFNAEKTKPAPYFRWSANLGVRGRAYLKPVMVPDSINGAPISPTQLTEYVEDLIVQERALELAFEGKRWFDLVRIAKRRGTPEYLANKVASKFADTSKAQEIRTILMNEAKWYLPLNK